MRQLEFFQKALANSVEILLNTHAQVLSHLQWLAGSKSLAIEKATKDLEFNSDDLCDYDEWSQSNMARDTMMRVVGVKSYLNDFDLVGSLRSRSRGMFSKAMTLTVYFMRDPDEILKSKAKLTDDEKIYLKMMKHLYDNRERNDASDFQNMVETNRWLRDLKHKYNILLTLEWGFSFDDMISDDFMNNGIRTKRVTIASRGGNIWE